MTLRDDLRRPVFGGKKNADGSGNVEAAPHRKFKIHQNPNGCRLDNPAGPVRRLEKELEIEMPGEKS